MLAPGQFRADRPGQGADLVQPGSQCAADSGALAGYGAVGCVTVAPAFRRLGRLGYVDAEEAARLRGSRYSPSSGSFQNCRR